MTVAFTDMDGADLIPLHMVKSYSVVASLTHHGEEKSSEDHLVGQTVVETGEQKVVFHFDLKNLGGSRFAIRFSISNSKARLATSTSEFTVYPSSVTFDSKELGGEVNKALPAATVAFRDGQAQLLTSLSKKDAVYVEVALLRDGSQVLVCSSSQTETCVNGTTVQVVQYGIATFTDLMVVDMVGSNFRYEFTIQGQSAAQPMKAAPTSPVANSASGAAAQAYEDRIIGPHSGAHTAYEAEGWDANPHSNWAWSAYGDVGRTQF